MREFIPHRLPGFDITRQTRWRRRGRRVRIAKRAPLDHMTQPRGAPARSADGSFGWESTRGNANGDGVHCWTTIAIQGCGEERRRTTLNESAHLSFFQPEYGIDP